MGRDIKPMHFNPQILMVKVELPNFDWQNLCSKNMCLIQKSKQSSEHIQIQGTWVPKIHVPQIQRYYVLTISGFVVLQRFLLGRTRERKERKRKKEERKEIIKKLDLQAWICYCTKKVYSMLQTALCMQSYGMSTNAN